MKPLYNYSKINHPLYKWGTVLVITITSIIAATLIGAFIPFGGFIGFQFTLIPALLILTITIWLMPEKDRCYEKLLEWLIIFYVLLICVWPPYVSIIPLPGKIWTPPARILSFLIAFFALVNFSVSRLAKQRLADMFKSHPLIMRTFTLFAIIQFLSLPLAHLPGTSASYFAKYFIVTTAIFLVVITCVRNTRALKILIYFAIPIVLFYVGIAFYQSAIEENVFGKYLPNWMIGGGESVGAVMRAVYRNGLYRVNGISLTSLEYAELFVYFSPFLFYYVMEHKNIFIKAIALFILTLAFLGISTTGSRLGNVGLLFGTMTYALIWSLKAWLLDKRNLLGPAIVTMYIAGIGAFMALITASTRIRGMIFGDSSTANSSNARIDQVTDGIPIILSNPIVGHGIGGGAQKLNYRNLGGDLTIDTYWLSVAIETGLVGLICFLLFFGALIWTAARFYIYDQDRHPLAKMGATLASTLACFLLIKLVLSQTVNNSLIYFVAAITLVISHIIHEKKTEITQK